MGRLFTYCIFGAALAWCAPALGQQVFTVNFANDQIAYDSTTGRTTLTDDTPGS